MKNIAVFIDIKNGQIAESSLRALEFASAWSNQQGFDGVIVYGFEKTQLEALNALNSIKEYVQIEVPGLVQNSQVLAVLLSHIQEKGISQILYVKSLLMDSVAAYLSGALAFPLISNVKELEKVSNGNRFTKSIFSGKANLVTEVAGDNFIAAFSKSFSSNLALPSGNSSPSLSSISLPLNSQSTIVENYPLTGSIPLPDAAVVVGGGRGLKDPSNWVMVEDLAKELGAATACSKPVSDLNWRPHHEHVGQTGVKIAPKLYIACGISGAIQHLAGVNGSRKIVVINNDPEAPFFKHADYGIVGDVFDVLPRLLNKLKSH
ncbi:electron transfer flavoprotein subunit alpha/FixB family protein [Aquirufa rosea]|uniref:Electron transfer flavoprotein subunit alpha/FixB family protein n=1 Tax=Aquirufa rosea TaxID=2509241 RepID=A0A4V1M5Q7_9BACT|nr:electron transfer flavoprotein subunit alpha/FixB family protein [Aquirufa rosea]RXK52252.1 electron transfer flavoprotein subunit alpha/FixB family protein [Aquirufa rosea]